MPGVNKIKKHLTDPFDDLTFNRIFEDLYTPLCRYSMKFVNDLSVAEDIVQDQFVYIWEKGKKLSEFVSIRAYLYTAVKNRSINYIKKNIASKELSFSEHRREIELPKELTNPAVILENQEIEIIIKKALQTLPEKCRTIFLMRRHGDMSNREIAEQLGISIKTVEAQMTIAIKKLTAYISDHWEFVFVLFINHLQKFF